MKFLKTIRFDPSDLQVFEPAAPQDELAVPGGFFHVGAVEGSLKGKQKQAFSNGFLSVESFGFSTFTSVAEISESDLQSVSQRLAVHALESMGAPSHEEAMLFAKNEVDYVCEMCADTGINSIFAVNRHFGENGEIKEEFRIVQAPGEALHARVWDIVEE